MPVTIDETRLKEIIHDEVQRAVQELLDELEFMTEEDFHDREEAMEQFDRGETIGWEDYKKKRNGQ